MGYIIQYKYSCGQFKEIKKITNDLNDAKEAFQEDQLLIEEHIAKLSNCLEKYREKMSPTHSLRFILVLVTLLFLWAPPVALLTFFLTLMLSMLQTEQNLNKRKSNLQEQLLNEGKPFAIKFAARMLEFKIELKENLSLCKLEKGRISIFNNANQEKSENAMKHILPPELSQSMRNLNTEGRTLSGDISSLNFPFIVEIQYKTKEKGNNKRTSLFFQRNTIHTIPNPSDLQRRRFSRFKNFTNPGSKPLPRAVVEYSRDDESKNTVYEFRRSLVGDKSKRRNPRFSIFSALKTKDSKYKNLAQTTKIFQEKNGKIKCKSKLSEVEFEADSYQLEEIHDENSSIDDENGSKHNSSN